MLKAPESPKTPETTPMQEEEQKLRNEAIVKFSLPGNNFFHRNVEMKVSEIKGLMNLIYKKSKRS
jgi:hypothetical protein